MKRKWFKGGGGVKGNAGGGGVKGNAGNAGARGTKGNAGNAEPMAAGKRSGQRRASAIALVIKEEWLHLVLAGKKTWEIRGSATARRGRVHLAKPGGLIVGSACVAGCAKIPKQDFAKHIGKHCVPTFSMVPYAEVWAWHLKSVVKYQKPFPYYHAPGAIVWVRPRPVVRKPKA